MRALASQNAAAGGAGIETGGSFGLLARTDIRDARNDLLVERASSAQRIRSLTSQGRNARATGNARATLTLLNTAQEFTKGRS